jgi:hypothetical protein
MCLLITLCVWHDQARMTDDSAKRSIRIPVLLTPEEVKNLDDYQFAHRIRTRSDAIRRLIELGSKTDAPAPTPAGPKARGKPRQTEPPGGQTGG